MLYSTYSRSNHPIKKTTASQPTFYPKIHHSRRPAGARGNQIFSQFVLVSVFPPCMVLVLLPFAFCLLPVLPLKFPFEFFLH